MNFCVRSLVPALPAVAVSRNEHYAGIPSGMNVQLHKLEASCKIDVREEQVQLVAGEVHREPPQILDKLQLHLEASDVAQLPIREREREQCLCLQVLWPYLRPISVKRPALVFWGFPCFAGTLAVLGLGTPKQRKYQRRPQMTLS